MQRVGRTELIKNKLTCKFKRSVVIECTHLTSIFRSRLFAHSLLFADTLCSPLPPSASLFVKSSRCGFVRRRNSAVATLLQQPTARCVCCALLICISPVTRQVKVLDRDKDGRKSTHDEKLGKVPAPTPETPETKSIYDKSIFVGKNRYGITHL